MSGSMWQQALAHHQAGRPREAQQICEQLLKLNPRQADALHLLGLACLGQGRPAEAVEAIERAVRLQPRDSAALNSLGSARRAMGDLDAAVAAYRNAVRHKPDYAEAHYNLGNALMAGGRHAAAIDSYRRALALRTDFADARHNLGRALQAGGRLDEAVDAYRAAITDRPASPQWLYNLAIALMELGRHDEAEHGLRAALLIWPEDPALRDGLVDTHVRLGDVLQARDTYDEAIAQYDRALALAPTHAVAVGNRAVALRQLHRFAESIAAFRAALALAPNQPVFRVGLATALLQVDQAHEAEALLRELLQANPGDIEALKALANALCEQNRDQEAISVLTQVLAVAPQDAQAHWQTACAWLRIGDDARGWPEYEWRFRYGPLGIREQTHAQPVWRGDTDIAGKTILLHGEQGFGDQIQFARYIPLLVARGAQVHLRTYEALTGLLASVDGIDQIVGPDQELPSFDVHAPLLSLPLAFGTTTRSVPALVPYLSVPEAAVARWRDRLAAAGYGPGPEPRVGLAFRGTTGGIADPRRPIAARHLRPILDSGARVVLVQKDTDPAELAGLRGALDLGPGLADFVDTAAVVLNLDLILTIDTSVAHLAGALGRPVWIMLRFAADWRWLTDRTDSPWYPTARLFRQDRAGDWDGVVARVVAALADQHAIGQPWRHPGTS